MDGGSIPPGSTIWDFQRYPQTSKDSRKSG